MALVGPVGNDNLVKIKEMSFKFQCLHSSSYFIFRISAFDFRARHKFSMARLMCLWTLRSTFARRQAVWDSCLSAPIIPRSSSCVSRILSHRRLLTKMLPCEGFPCHRPLLNLQPTAMAQFSLSMSQLMELHTFSSIQFHLFCRRYDYNNFVRN